MVGDRGSEIIRSTPVDGTLEDRNVRTSIWERPNKITLVGTTDLPFGFRLGFTYIGMSGQAYTYVSAGRSQRGWASAGLRHVERCGLRAEGRGRHHSGGPDAIRRARQVHSEGALPSKPAWPTHGAKQLSRSLGARDHGATVEAFGLADRRTLEVTADLFNVLNFVNSDWGLVRQTFGDLGNAVPLLQLVGYDTSHSRGVYETVPVARREIDVDASRWRLQLAATVFF